MQKFENILTAVGAGGLVIILTILAAFRIDFVSIGEALKQMNGLTAALIISAVLLLIGIALKIADRRVTPRNVQRKIHQWLDEWKLLHGVFDYEPWHFTIPVTFFGQKMFIGRPKNFAGGFIEVQLRTTGIIPDHRKAFEAMSKPEKSQFYAQLTLEISRARIQFSGKPDLSDVTISKLIRMRSKLDKSEIMDGLYQVLQSARIVWNTTGLRLADSPVLKQIEEEKPSALLLPKSEVEPTQKSHHDVEMVQPPTD